MRNDETDDKRNDQQPNIDNIIEVQDITVIVDIHEQSVNEYDVQTEEINDFHEIVEESSVVIVDVNDQSAIEYDVKNEDIRDNSEMIEEVSETSGNNDAENVNDNVSSNHNPPPLHSHDNTSSELKLKCSICCLEYKGRK